VSHRRPLLVLVAGPYRSGTGDDPQLIRANVRAMEEAAFRVYQIGHLPVLGEWLALPLIAQAGSRRMGDGAWQALFHPVAERLARRCDACLRIGGYSEGADQMVAIFLEARRPVYRDVEELPALTAQRG